MMNEPISTIMTREVITVGPNDSLTVAQEIFLIHKIPHVPVVENKKLVGIISSYDLVKLGKSFDEYKDIKIREVMTKGIATLEPNDKIGSAAEVFMEHLFHGIPITNARGEVVGIVTTHDILKYFYRREYPNG